MTTARPGPNNLITDVNGLLVGNAADDNLKSGVTVLTADTPFLASVDVMGGAPGTRETDCLAPHNLVDRVDALVLSGGSAFGLESATGVSEALRQQGKGYPVGSVSVPIVPAAILFDLLNGGDKEWTKNPYHELGQRAFNSAKKEFSLGSAGAGYGALTATLKGGLGSASLLLDNGITVGALVAANPRGSTVVPKTGKFWASPFEVEEEFGGCGFTLPEDGLALPESGKYPQFNPRANTTIAIIATDAKLDKAGLKRIAVAAQDGIARAVVPAHTPLDGDLVFSVSTGARSQEVDVADLSLIGHAAAVCLSRAIARGVFHATAHPEDILPCWQQVFGEDST